MERVFGLATMALRVGQHLDDLVELEERARPAVLDEERGGVVVRRALVDEVNAKATGRSGEMVEPVEPGFRRPPVVAVRPMGRIAPDRPELRPLPPPIRLDLVGPSGAGEAGAQIRQGLVRDIDPERFGGRVHPAPPRHCHRRFRRLPLPAEAERSREARNQTGVILDSSNPANGISVLYDYKLWSLHG